MQDWCDRIKKMIQAGDVMNHKKKMVAPIVVTVIIVMYLLAIGTVVMLFQEIPIVVKILILGIPLALAGVMIGVLVSRIKEIRSGEEDDLSKY